MLTHVRPRAATAAAEANLEATVRGRKCTGSEPCENGKQWWSPVSAEQFPTIRRDRRLQAVASLTLGALNLWEHSSTAWLAGGHEKARAIGLRGQILCV